jgi:glycosyltransferase involved in cell wall biosynthesis
MQRYASLLQDGFTKAGHEVRVLRPPVVAGRMAIGKAAKKWLGYIDKLIVFPAALKGGLEWPDIVHICDHSSSYLLKYLDAKPHVITCHDLLAVRSALGEIPEKRTRWSGRQLQRLILDNMALARTVVCVSDATRADLQRLVPGNGRTVTRIYNGLNYNYAPMEQGEAMKRLHKLGLPPDQAFILHVGGNQWYKNRLSVLKIFALLRKRPATRNVSIVMAGKPWTQEMRRFVRMQDIGLSAIEMVGVAGEDLRALYSRAEALLFPSLQEGFGWPIAEAQACGCPVVTSNRAPMTEVGGEAAFYVDPLDYEAAATTTASIIGLREQLQKTNLRNAVRFDQLRMIDAYLELYTNLLSRAQAVPSGG